MEISRRPLYNSLRMNWVLDPTLEAAPWQVEDYRSLPLDVLFQRLQGFGLHLDKLSFKAFAEGVDTPEDLTDELLIDFPKDFETNDQVYLVIFELWRRLLPEKNCLSIFCDELDQQIYLYDRRQTEKSEAIQDALANLQAILDENVDNGADPIEAFECIEAGCANDLEIFIHDYILEQIDSRNFSYASELLDGLGNYLHDVRWADFLRARVLEGTDPEEAKLIIESLVKDKAAEPDIELNFEMLALLVRMGEKPMFELLVKKTTDLLEIEDDFQTLVSFCADFFHRLDNDKKESALQKILELREKRDPQGKFDRRDPHLAEFSKIIST